MVSGDGVCAVRAAGTLLAAFPPEVAGQVDAVVQRARRGRIGGCSHLDEQPVALICLKHPNMIRCMACHARHAETHTDAEEYGCDICGAHLPDAVDLALFRTHHVEIDALVPIGRGRSAAVGVIVVGSWGCCPSHVHVVAEVTA